MKRHVLVAIGIALVVTLSAVSCQKKTESESSAPSTAPRAAPAPSATPEAAPATGGGLSGVVSFKGTVPPAKTIQLEADPQCVTMHPGGLKASDIEVGTGNGLKDTLVYVSSDVSGTFTPPSASVTIDQQGCWYHPRMVAMMAGQTLVVRNSDNTVHNFHTQSKVNPVINQVQSTVGDISKVLSKPEKPFDVKCDIHPWMKGTLAVFSHPYFAVTDDNGAYTIPNLPPGDYTITAYHPKAGTVSQKVTVDSSGKATLNLTIAK